MNPVFQVVFLCCNVLAACSGANDAWTAEQAFEPTRRRLDRDHDGTVDEEEYLRASYSAPAFREVDANGDGDLSLPEIESLVLRQDPLSFDGLPDRDPVIQALNPDIFHPETGDTRYLHELFACFEAEVREQNQAIPLPSPDEVKVASATGSLDSPEVRALLSRYREAWRAVGLVFPARLSEPTPAGAAIP